MAASGDTTAHPESGTGADVPRLSAGVISYLYHNQWLTKNGLPPLTCKGAVVRVHYLPPDFRSFLWQKANKNGLFLFGETFVRLLTIAISPLELPRFPSIPRALPQRRSTLRARRALPLPPPCRLTINYLESHPTLLFTLLFSFAPFFGLLRVCLRLGRAGVRASPS